MMIGLRSTSLGELKSILTRPLPDTWPLPMYYSRSASGDFSRPGARSEPCRTLNPRPSFVQQLAERCERVTFLAIQETLAPEIP